MKKVNGNSRVNKKWAAVGILAVALVIGGVVFAAYSQTLTIMGGAEYTQNDPLVRWKAGSVTHAQTGGGGFDSTVTTDVSADQLTIASYMVQFSAAGSATVRATIENVGGAKASVSTLNTPTITCTAQGAADVVFADALCRNITYIFQYADGNAIVAGDELAAGDSVEVRVVVELAAVPTVGRPGAVDIAIGNQTITYVD
ncbi:hypothetical protein FWC63_00470 [Candidatus Saccharibacteria bacterium]|nr:hypothetical protein [Candidatus Saccharibacteria bacterium]